MCQDTICISDITQLEGWTYGLVKKLLPVPDIIKKVKYTSRVMHLHYLRKVMEAEETDEWKNAQAPMKRRREAAKKSVKTKTDKLLKAIEAVKITIKKLDEHVVLKEAIASYNSYNEYATATVNADKEFLDRITVNYIRHNLTTYDNAINYLFGKVGKAQAYNLLSERVYKLISTEYPMYTEECTRQLEYKQLIKGMRECFG